MPNRKDLMSLNSRGNYQTKFYILEGEFSYTKHIPEPQKYNNLNIKDIGGSVPLLKPFTYTNKETFVNRTDDILGGSPSKIIKNYISPEYNLRVDDIKGA